MWMNKPLGVMQMIWQIQEEERHRAHLSKQDVSSFPDSLYLMSLMDPGGAGAAGWLFVWVLKDTGE